MKEPLSPQQSSAACAEVIRRHARSFYFAARFLPPARRRGIFVLYAFYRTVDDLVDRRPLGCHPAVVAAELQAWRQWLGGEPSAIQAAHLLPALRTVIEKYAIPRSLLLEVLEGVERDFYPMQLQTFADLEHYCYQVAGSVGLVMAHVLGATSPPALERACTLGIAMQLTNVLRDIGEDLDRGMIYLPAEEMRQFGYSAARLADRRVDSDFVALMRQQIARAHRLYQEGIEGIRLLPRDCQFAILVAARMYGSILRKVELGGYDAFRYRARTNLIEKFWIAGQSYRLLH
jgi:phytoene synthase